MESTQKTSKKLLIFSLIIFVLEYLGIVGAYWIFDGKFGDATLTISRYVGLETWSSLVFCACNIAICLMMIYYILAPKRSAILRFLMFVFIGSFLALSISPHVPDESMPATIHRFFAGIMFVTMSLIGLRALCVAKRKVSFIYSLLFVAFAAYFCISDVLRIEYFMNGIFWYESAYLFAFFGLLLLPSETEV